MLVNEPNPEMLSPLKDRSSRVASSVQSVISSVVGKFRESEPVYSTFSSMYDGSLIDADTLPD